MSKIYGFLITFEFLIKVFKNMVVFTKLKEKFYGKKKDFLVRLKFLVGF